MVTNRIKGVFLLNLALFSSMPTLQAGAGKSFGFFGLGAVTGGLVGAAIAKRNNNNNQPVVQERIVERPVYVAQPVAQPAAGNYEADRLRYENERQQREINDLKRQLRSDHRDADRRKAIKKDTKPATISQLKESAYDDWDPEV